jgi:hypothetical protein
MTKPGIPAPECRSHEALLRRPSMTAGSTAALKYETLPDFVSVYS